MQSFRIRHGRMARVFVKPIGLRQMLAVWLRGYRPWLFGAWAKPNKAAREFERSQSVAAPVERHHSKGNTMLKSLKFVSALLIASAALAASGGAQAGTPTSIVNATGTGTYPTESALSVEKDTSSGNRVKVRYSSGFQYVADDASWSRYALLLGGLTKPVAVPTSTTGQVIDIAKAFTGCNGGQSYAAWANVGQPEYIGDNCAFANAAKAASQ